MVFLFIGAGILALLIVVYENKNRPQWAESNSMTVQNLSTIEVETELDLLDLEKGRLDSHKAAVAAYREVVSNMAMKQIEIAYGWETLDQESKSLTERSLADVLKRVKFKQLSELSVYMDFLNMKRCGLYAIGTDELEVVLQEIYESVNKAMLKLMDEEEEEIEDNNNGDEDEMVS